MQNDCAFCDRSQFEERLVAENKAYYVIATLGQITDGGYVLVVPKEHISCAGAFTLEQTNSLTKTTQDVWRALASEYSCNAQADQCPITIFEHGIVGQTVKHAHLHLLPAAFDLAPKIFEDFPKAEIEELRYAVHLQKLYGERLSRYLSWTMPNGKAMVCWNPPAPNQYLRIVAAELLGRPERANWRTMDPELDRRLYLETVTRLKPYFV